MRVYVGVCVCINVSASLYGYVSVVEYYFSYGKMCYFNYVKVCVSFVYAAF